MPCLRASLERGAEHRRFPAQPVKAELSRARSLDLNTRAFVGTGFQRLVLYEKKLRELSVARWQRYLRRRSAHFFERTEHQRSMALRFFAEPLPILSPRFDEN